MKKKEEKKKKKIKKKEKKKKKKESGLLWRKMNNKNTYLSEGVGEGVLSGSASIWRKGEIPS
jgi:hypothetical protein